VVMGNAGIAVEDEGTVVVSAPVVALQVAITFVSEVTDVKFPDVVRL